MAAKLYTKGGDRGVTSLLSGQRVPKDHPRVEAYGTLDELQSHLGLAYALCSDPKMRPSIRRVQDDLLHISALLATDKESPPSIPTQIHTVGTDWLEDEIDHFSGLFPLPKRFVLPGNSVDSASLHMARTVCRRAERVISAIPRRDAAVASVLTYVNRLSDLLFAMAWALEAQQLVREALGLERVVA